MNKTNTKTNDNEKQLGFFKRLWEGWKKIARKIGDFNARVILTVFYFVLLSPFAILLKLFTDPLEIKKKDHIGWHSRENNSDLSIMEKAVRQS